MLALAFDTTPLVRPETPEVTVRAYVDAALDLLEREGLAVDVEHRMQDWAEIVRSGAKNAGANPTFDPDATGPFEPDHAFWLRVRRGGEVVAVAASRLIACHRYYPYVAAGLLWSRAPGRPVPILVEEPGFRGPMAHSGGLWVRPDARGTGLSWIIPRPNQAISQLAWPIEDVCSVIFAGVHDAGDGRHRSGADVGHRARDGARGGHAAKKRHHGVGDALGHELLVGVVFGRVAELVGHAGAQQRLDGAQQCNRQRGRDQQAHGLPGEVG